MCGISGFYAPKMHLDNRKGLAKVMGDSLVHRGPDAFGDWHSDTGISLIHRRLSILDLSPLGHQPMLSHNQRYVLTFNGEIYNYIELKNELVNLGHTFKGHSDSEVLVQALEAWGVKKCLNRLVGMFAFALWDKREQSLTLARDRMGEKPLYFGLLNQNFVFGSELKALLKISDQTPKIDQKSVYLYFKYSYVPAPYSIYENIFKLKPAHFITFKKFDLDEMNLQNPYWQVQKNTIYNFSNMNENEVLNQVKSELSESVKMQMHSDVPMGCFLSGGIDSSLITALLNENSEEKINTFTIGFSEKNFDESKDAQAVAKHLGVHHHVLKAHSKDLIRIVDNIPFVYDEPFSDSSQLPTMLLSELTKKHITVCLSGDGADEVFGGYTRYLWAPKIWDTLSQKPFLLKKWSAHWLQKISPSNWDSLFQTGQKIFKIKLNHSHMGNKIFKLSNILDSKDAFELYHRLLTYWPQGLPTKNKQSFFNLDLKNYFESTNMNFSEKMRHTDLMYYLPEDILVKVDRASMAHSLELRAPYLNHRLIELAEALPHHYLIRAHQGKYILKELLGQYLPKDLINKPKTGFTPPIGEWLRTDLKPWAESLIYSKYLESDGILNPQIILKYWREHINYKYNWEYQLWNILMFLHWKRYWNIN